MCNYADIYTVNKKKVIKQTMSQASNADEQSKNKTDRKWTSPEKK